jgi:aryl-alcohol dehydrogenase-like predicted oxidoreductase
MEYRRLGNSGLEVSVVCLGTMTFGDRTGTSEANEIVAHAYANGVNFIDTADVYVAGASETIAGAAIKAQRARWIVATKAGNPIAGDENQPPHTGGSSRRWLFQACDASLARLRTDWIDIYYLHIDDRHTSLDETVAALGALIDAGKIRYFGVSNFRGWRIAELLHCCERLGVTPPVVCQPYYNLLNRMPEVEVLAACDYYGLGVASYSPIARGVLTAKYAAGVVPHGSRGALKDRRIMQTEFREESFAVAETLKAYAARTGRTPVQFALAWLWANRIVTSVIAGPRTLAQWQDYVSAIGTAWSDEDEALVDSLVHPGHPSTPGYSDPAYPIYGRRRQ